MLGLEIVLIILVIALCFLLYKFVDIKRKNEKLKVYQDITNAMISHDPKTRVQIEKQCNNYLEHKVINKKIINQRYLAQVNLLLDDIKYINAVYSIEPYEQVSKVCKPSENIGKANNVENTTIENVVVSTMEESKTVKKSRNTKKGEKEQC